MPVRRQRVKTARLNTSRARAACDALERRQLLAAEAFVAKFDFAPEGVSIAGGFIADTGKKYQAQGDYTFGWDVENTRMLERGSPKAQRYDTIAHFGKFVDGEVPEGGATSWSVKVPNGLYEVNVLAGDAKFTNSVYCIRAEEVTVVNSKPTKASPWRSGTAYVYVADGKLTLSDGYRASNNKIASVEIRQVDPYVTGQDLVNPFSNAAIVQNEVATDIAIPVMKELGMKVARLWYDVKDWDDGPDRAFLKYFKAHKDAGFSVMAIFDTPSVPTYEQAKAFFERMTQDSMAFGNIDFWEIGNETNIHGFWPGTTAEYVNQVLKPAYEVISPLGKPVIGAGASYNTLYAQELVNNGYTNYCDYAGFHPYGESAATVIQRATEAKAIFNMPMIVTEWNVQFIRNKDNWAEQVRLASIGLAEVSYLSAYFALSNSATHVGEGGLIELDGARNEPFFEVSKGWGSL